eukprot:jgi/Bigna1/71194/fgenesh1_pg.14_\
MECVDFTIDIEQLHDEELGRNLFSLWNPDKGYEGEDNTKSQLDPTLQNRCNTNANRKISSLAVYKPQNVPPRKSLHRKVRVMRRVLCGMVVDEPERKGRSKTRRDTRPPDPPDENAEGGSSSDGSMRVSRCQREWRDARISKTGVKMAKKTEQGQLLSISDLSVEDKIKIGKLLREVAKQQKDIKALESMKYATEQTLGEYRTRNAGIAKQYTALKGKLHQSVGLLKQYQKRLQVMQGAVLRNKILAEENENLKTRVTMLLKEKTNTARPLPRSAKNPEVVPPSSFSIDKRRMISPSLSTTTGLPPPHETLEHEGNYRNSLHADLDVDGDTRRRTGEKSATVTMMANLNKDQTSSLYPDRHYHHRHHHHHHRSSSPLANRKTSANTFISSKEESRGGASKVLNPPPPSHRKCIPSPFPSSPLSMPPAPETAGAATTAPAGPQLATFKTTDSKKAVREEVQLLLRTLKQQQEQQAEKQPDTSDVASAADDDDDEEGEGSIVHMKNTVTFGGGSEREKERGGKREQLRHKNSIRESLSPPLRNHLRHGGSSTKEGEKSLLELFKNLDLRSTLVQRLLRIQRGTHTTSSSSTSTSTSQSLAQKKGQTQKCHKNSLRSKIKADGLLRNPNGRKQKSIIGLKCIPELGGGGEGGGGGEKKVVGGQHNKAMTTAKALPATDSSSSNSISAPKARLLSSTLSPSSMMGIKEQQQQQKRAKKQSEDELGLHRGNISTSSAQTAPAILVPLRDWRTRDNKISSSTIKKAGNSHEIRSTNNKGVKSEQREAVVELPDLDGPPPPPLMTAQKTSSSFERAALLFANGYRDSIANATAPWRAHSTNVREQGLDDEEPGSCDNIEDDSSLVAILNDGTKEALVLPRVPSSPSSSRSRPSSEARHFGGVSAVIHAPNKAEASQQRFSYDASLLDIIDALDEDDS